MTVVDLLPAVASGVFVDDLPVVDDLDAIAASGRCIAHALHGFAPSEIPMYRKTICAQPISPANG